MTEAELCWKRERKAAKRTRTRPARGCGAFSRLLGERRAAETQAMELREQRRRNHAEKAQEVAAVRRGLGHRLKAFVKGLGRLGRKGA